MRLFFSNENLKQAMVDGHTHSRITLTQYVKLFNFNEIQLLTLLGSLASIFENFEIGFLNGEITQENWGTSNISI